MYSFEKTAHDQMTFRLSGSIDPEQMRSLLDEFIAQTETMSEVKLLYIIEGFEMPGLSAIAVEMKRIPKLFSIMGKFSRCAVVSDKEWIKTAAKIEAVFLPFDIETFNADDTAAARTWLDAPDQTQ